MTVTGQNGIPSLETSGNIIHPSIDLKLSLRLPPNFPVEAAESTLRDILLNDVPYNAKVELYNVHASTGWSSSEYEPSFEKAIQEASMEFFGKSMQSIGDGATIPLIGVL